MDNEKRYEKVRIDGYGADGHVKRSVSNRLGAAVIRVVMQDMLHEGLVPVIRDVGMPWEGKADEKREGKPEGKKERETAEQLAAKVFDQVREGLPKKGLSVEDLPMLLEWSCGEVKFRAAGRGEDVLDAQCDFLDAMGEMLEEDEEPVLLMGSDGEIEE